MRSYWILVCAAAACGGGEVATRCESSIAGEPAVLAVPCGGGALAATSGTLRPAPRGDPTNYEQQMLELLNSVRMDPAAAAAELDFVLDEGTDPPLCAYPRAPLTMNPALLAAARAHSNDMLARNYFDHQTPEGLMPPDRMIEAGYEPAQAGENIALFWSSEDMPVARSTHEAHAGLFVDDCCEGRGHRVNMLYDDVSEVGIGITSGPTAPEGESENGIAWTQDFATPVLGPTLFVLGVVFRDRDGDRRYDPGEGEAGVRVTAVGLDSEETVTDGTGGYAFAVPDGGRIALELAPREGPHCALVEIEGASRQVDLILAP